MSLGQGSVCVIDLCAESLLRPSWLASPSSVLTWKTPSPATGLWLPALLPLGSRPPQAAEDTASHGLTDTQTHATTHWPQDHSNSGHTEPLIQSPATQQPRSHRNRTTLLPQQNLPSSH